MSGRLPNRGKLRLHTNNRLTKWASGFSNRGYGNRQTKNRLTNVKMSVKNYATGRNRYLQDEFLHQQGKMKIIRITATGRKRRTDWRSEDECQALTKWPTRGQRTGRKRRTAWPGKWENKELRPQATLIAPWRRKTSATSASKKIAEESGQNSVITMRTLIAHTEGDQLNCQAPK